MADCHDTTTDKGYLNQLADELDKAHRLTACDWIGCFSKPEFRNTEFRNTESYRAKMCSRHYRASRRLVGGEDTWLEIDNADPDPSRKEVRMSDELATNIAARLREIAGKMPDYTTEIGRTLDDSDLARYSFQSPAALELTDEQKADCLVGHGYIQSKVEAEEVAGKLDNAIMGEGEDDD